MNSWVVIGLLAGWFSATVLYQIFTPRLMRLTRRYNLSRVLPSFRFFAERPRCLFLAYRDSLAGGTMGPWHELHFQRRQTWLSAFWHPAFITSDVARTCIEHLVPLVERDPPLRPGVIRTSFPFRAVQHYLRQHEHPAESQGRQFRILENDGHFSDAPSTVLFTSQLARVGDIRP